MHCLIDLKKDSRNSTTGSLRIIAGEWRRRRIYFESSTELRPTTDAARESLFNWLQDRIEGTVCLDLFAGSGALGFEALSRGAGEVDFIDSNRLCIKSLHQTSKELQTERCTIVHRNALDYLQRCNQKFDIVFLDPPYRSGLAAEALQKLDSMNCLNLDARIYLEVERDFSSVKLADRWVIVRNFDAGSRSHYLLARQ
ncbi:MAG: 16S rRNA (guanine(966)-N(2))-methyltransferase RsmD [Gammaproteobacteria bacterium]|nr:16S rRNA (guanine(966)-N(2))-methyltransferase RsmD [Gammaproteobacteria bacterium]